MGPVTVTAPPPTLEAAAGRLADLLCGRATTTPDLRPGELELEPVIRARPLARAEPPVDTWAVDGGQAVVADARCLQVVVTRAARVRYRDGACVGEDEGELQAVLLGGVAERAAALAAPALSELGPETTVDANLLRDRGEWETVAVCVEEADPGGLVLVDGDLEPDWRLPRSLVTEVLRRARERGVTVAGVTKHSSLAGPGGTPLVGLLESEAQEALGPRATWWAPVARTRGQGQVRVVAARLDPDARFAFRVDLPAGHDPEAALGSLSALCDDAAFPGYPYPLSVADRLAACSGWLRGELRLHLDELLERAGVGPEARERAFADRHDLMERAR